MPPHCCLSTSLTHLLLFLTRANIYSLYVYHDVKAQTNKSFIWINILVHIFFIIHIPLCRINITKYHTLWLVHKITKKKKKMSKFTTRKRERGRKIVYFVICQKLQEVDFLFLFCVAKCSWSLFWFSLLLI